MAYSVAVWDWTPDTWGTEGGESGSPSLTLIQDSNNKIIYYNNSTSQWAYTNSTTITPSVFENYGMNMDDVSNFNTAIWTALYDDNNFTAPFKVIHFIEEEEISSPKLELTTKEREYVTARSYVSTISDTDLQKIKSLNLG